MSVTQAMVGSPVYGEGGDQLGKVKEVRGQYFKVDARMQPDYWLRADCVRSGDGDRLVVMDNAEHFQQPDGDETETRGTEMRGGESRTATMGTGAGTATGGRHESHQQTQSRENENVQLREERLHVEKEQEQAGEVRLGKRVTEREETVNVPVREERVVVERTPVQGEARRGEITGRDETIEVPVTRERVNVEKEAVVAEEVNVRKETTERQQPVQATLRKEELEVEGDGTEVVGDNPNAPRQGTYEHEQTRRS